MIGAVNTDVSHASSNSEVTANGTVLSANLNRRGGLIQNLSTDKLYVKFGETAAADDFRAILPGGGADSDGYGGSLALGGYRGLVSVYSAGSVKCRVSEDS